MKMKIKISDDRKIFEIQEEFNRIFPYLKIEFFSSPHKTGIGTPKKLIKNNNDTLGTCRKVHKNGFLYITPLMTVSELEQLLYEAYGLGVQVFRKSGKVWLETTVTDSWTLADQNKEGEALSLIKR